jgi:hypothetical protein
VAAWLFSPGTPVSSTNKTNRRDITEILLKVEIFSQHWKFLGRISSAIAMESRLSLLA